MECMRKLWLNFLIWVLLLLVGCNQVESENGLLVEKETGNEINDQSITIDFEILNKPILDESVIISLLFKANDSSKKIFLNYLLKKKLMSKMIMEISTNLIILYMK